MQEFDTQKEKKTHYDSLKKNNNISNMILCRLSVLLLCVGFVCCTTMQVNTYSVGSQIDPFIILGANGEFVVTWASKGQDWTEKYGVYAKVFNAMGEPVAAGRRRDTTSDLWISSGTKPDNQKEPTGIFLSSGQYALMYVDDDDIRIQFYTKTLMPGYTPPITIRGPASGDICSIFACALPNGGFALSYKEESGTNTLKYSIYGTDGKTKGEGDIYDGASWLYAMPLCLPTITASGATLENGVLLASIQDNKLATSVTGSISGRGGLRYDPLPAPQMREAAVGRVYGKHVILSTHSLEDKIVEKLEEHFVFEAVVETSATFVGYAVKVQIASYAEIFSVVSGSVILTMPDRFETIFEGTTRINERNIVDATFLNNGSILVVFQSSEGTFGVILDNNLAIIRPQHMLFDAAITETVKVVASSLGGYMYAGVTLHADTDISLEIFNDVKATDVPPKVVPETATPETEPPSVLPTEMPTSSSTNPPTPSPSLTSGPEDVKTVTPAGVKDVTVTLPVDESEGNTQNNGNGGEGEGQEGVQGGEEGGGVKVVVRTLPPPSVFWARPVEVERWVGWVIAIAVTGVVLGMGALCFKMRQKKAKRMQAEQTELRAKAEVGEGSTEL